MDAMGADFWLYDNLTDQQNHLALALKPEWTSLRVIFKQAQADTKNRKINANVRWEKLHVLGILEADRSRKNEVYVCRGTEWQAWAEKNANLAHSLQMITDGAPHDEVF